MKPGGGETPVVADVEKGRPGVEKGFFCERSHCRPVAAGVCSMVMERDGGQGPRM